MNNRKVKSARLHTSLYIDGVGDLGPTLPKKEKVVPGFAMVATELGLEIFAVGNKGPVEGFVPWSNVQSITFDKEATSGAKAA